MRVLVVEDEPAVRHLIDRLLTGRGHHVLTAPTAAEATALLYDFPGALDVALLDLILPGMSGLTYAEQLERMFPGVRVVIMTGWMDGAQLGAAEARGPLLWKPFSRESLISATESTPV